MPLAARVEVVVDRVERELEAVGDSEFVEDVVQVVFLSAPDNIFSAISLFLKPWATRATISRSRWLSGDRSRSRGAGACGGAAIGGGVSSLATNCRMTAAVVCESNQISPACTLRMLLIRSSVAVCLRTIPDVPSFIAWTNSFLSSEAVSTITRVLFLAI